MPERARGKLEAVRCCEVLVFLVREVGFEPTNPYGTGASGLRFQDPTEGLFDLAWQLPHSKSIPVLEPRRCKALIGFPRALANHVHVESTGKTFNSAATGPTEYSD